MGELTTIDRDELQELRDENQRMFVALHEDCCKDFVNCNKGCEHLVKQLRADIASRQSCERSMRDALIAADEAMVWELGGEPIPTLMIEARAKIKAALAGQQKPQECGRCDNGEPCTNQYGICSRHGGQPHGELPRPKTGGTV